MVSTGTLAQSGSSTGGDFAFVLILGMVATAFGACAWMGRPRSFRPRYRSLAGAGPGLALLEGVALIVGSSVFVLHDGARAVLGAVAVALLVLGGIYMFGYGAVGLPDVLRPRPQRGLSRTPSPPVNRDDSSWEDDVLKRRPRDR